MSIRTKLDKLERQLPVPEADEYIVLFRLADGTLADVHGEPVDEAKLERSNPCIIGRLSIEEIKRL